MNMRKGMWMKRRGMQKNLGGYCLFYYLRSIAEEMEDVVEEEEEEVEEEENE